MKKYFRIVVFIAIISCLSGAILGFVNSITEPIIIDNAIALEKKNLVLLFPDGEFKPIDYKDDEGIVLEVYKVNKKGYVFKTTCKGYNSSTPIVILIGMDTEGTIINVIPLEQQETNNIGSKCFEEENIKKLYVGKTIDQNADAISGATFTSNAMKTMISKAQEAFRKVK